MKPSHKKTLRANNKVEQATTTNKTWGFHPVPNKGGRTTNASIVEKPNKEG